MLRKTSGLVKIDLRDEKLLALLRENSRMQVSELSRKLGLNKDTVTYRIQRLDRHGVITRYYPEIDYSAFGHFVGYVFMLLDEVHQEKTSALVEELKSHPNTEALLEYNDRWDLRWTLVVKDLEQLNDIISDITTRYAEVISEKEVLLVVHWNRTSLRSVRAGERCDKKDYAILRALDENARTPAVELARNVGLSPDAVIRRIRRLIEGGVIKRFTIAVNAERIGKELYTLVLNMKSFDECHQNRFREFARQRPQIIRHFRTMGAWHVLLLLMVDDAAQFHHLFKSIKTEFSSIIKSYDVFNGYKLHAISSFPKAIRHEEADA